MMIQFEPHQRIVWRALNPHDWCLDEESIDKYRYEAERIETCLTQAKVEYSIRTMRELAMEMYARCNSCCG